jgi:hypothetical protein
MEKSASETYISNLVNASTTQNSGNNYMNIVNHRYEPDLSNNNIGSRENSFENTKRKNQVKSSQSFLTN